MTRCLICEKSDEDSSLVNCDLCKAALCLECSGVKATEQRVLTLNKRVLSFYCVTCKAKIEEMALGEGTKDQLYMEVIEAKNVIIGDKLKIIDLLERSIELMKPGLQSAGVDVNKGAERRQPNKPLNDNSAGMLVSGVGGQQAVKVSEGTGTHPLEREQRDAMRQVIDLGLTDQVLASSTEAQSRVPHDKQPKDGFTVVKYRKNRKNRTSVGRSEGAEGLKAVEARSWIFVSRLCPTTSEDDVKQYLAKKDIPVSECGRLQIVSKQIAAFKVAVNKSDEDKVLSGDLWPVNAIVRPYNKHLNFQRGPVNLKQT